MTHEQYQQFTVMLVSAERFQKEGRDWHLMAALENIRDLADTCLSERGVEIGNALIKARVEAHTKMADSAAESNPSESADSESEAQPADSESEAQPADSAATTEAAE